VVQCYVSALAAAGMGIATVNAATHWAGAVLFPSSVALVDVAHQSSEMDAFEFSRRTLVALDSAVQLARAGIARIEADPSSRQRALCALTIFPSSTPLAQVPSARDAARAVASHLSRRTSDAAGAACDQAAQHVPGSVATPMWAPARVCVGDVFTRLGRMTEDEDECADPCSAASRDGANRAAWRLEQRHQRQQQQQQQHGQNHGERDNAAQDGAAGITVVEHDYSWNAEHKRWDRRS
jgi:hypothetical protein